MSLEDQPVWHREEDSRMLLNKLDYPVREEENIDKRRGIWERNYQWRVKSCGNWKGDEEVDERKRRMREGNEIMKTGRNN